MVNKNKYINKGWIPALMLSFLVASCSLDIEQTDSLFSEGESAVFNGVADVDASLTNIYNNISGQTGDQANLYALTEVTTDELLVPTRGTDWGDNGVWRTLHTHEWGATHAQVLAVWNNKNSAVLRCTEVIDPLSNATTGQLAEAKFYRAYNMWIVMDFYGQVPFRNPTDGPDVTPDVMSRAQAYEMVIADLTAAIEGLPATTANKNRPSSGAAKFLKAKVLLNSGVYLGAGDGMAATAGSAELAEVIKLVDELEAEGYSISASGEYFDVFVGPSFGNQDVIWGVNAGSGNRTWNSLHYNQAHPDNGGGGWNGFTTMAEFYDKFEGPTATNAIGSGQEERRGYTNTLASTNADNYGFGFGFQLGQMYTWDGTASKALENRTGDALAFTKEMPGLIGNNEVTGMRLLKYSPANGGFTEGVVMARFSDAHLMRAEAMLASGGDALGEVNKLRALRANTPPLTALSADDLLDERARELFTEGWRRNDLIRFGKFSAAWQFKEANDGNRALFPIPSNALLSNPGLVQNPGY